MTVVIKNLAQKVDFLTKCHSNRDCRSICPVRYIFLYIHFQLMRELGKNFGFEQHGKPVCTSAPGDRKTLVYTLTKDC